MQVNDSDETSDQVAQKIRALAEDSFAQHEVIPRGDREWLCKRPGTGAYHFTVIARRGVLIVYGDIGDWILSMFSDDPVGWAARAVLSPDYFFEKLQASKDGGKAFYLEEVKVWLREQAKQDSDPSDGRIADALKDLSELEEDHGLVTREAALDVLTGYFDDISWLGVAPSARSFWLLEAMRWFTGRLAAAASAELRVALERDLPGGAT